MMSLILILTAAGSPFAFRLAAKSRRRCAPCSGARELIDSEYLSLPLATSPNLNLGVNWERGYECNSLDVKDASFPNDIDIDDGFQE